MHPVIEIEKDKKYEYRGWKIMAITLGWEAVRINPTKFFRASSLEAAVASIDHREDNVIFLRSNVIFKS